MNHYSLFNLINTVQILYINIALQSLHRLQDNKYYNIPNISKMDVPSPPKKQASAITNNKMFRKCIKTLMHRLLHQFRSQSYDSNGILNQYYIELQSNQQSYQKQQQKPSQFLQQPKVESEDKSDKSSNQDEAILSIWNQKEYEQVIKLWPQISVFVWEMSHSPKWYVQMLRNQQIYAEESECIDMHVFTSKIYRKVMAEASKMTPYTKQFEIVCADQIYFFLEEVSVQICRCFKDGQRIVVNQLNYVTSIVQKSQILNFFLLYKIFKDIALICKHRIITELEQGLFRNIQTDVLDSFALYIIQKYEVLDMEMTTQEKQETPEQGKETKQKIPITERIMNANNVRWRQAIREDGQIGILVQLQDQKQAGKSVNYMIMFDEDDKMSVVNSNSLSKQWKVCKQAEENFQILNLVKSKKALAQKMRNSSTSAPLRMTMIENVGVIGGSMGKCLAEIDTYENVGDFMISLSKRTVIGGSFNYLLMQVPLLGYVFVTGGFTYTFYYIFSNKYASSDKKMRQLRNVTIGSATSIGSGLIGAAIGQTLIPIPMLGAFVGGLVGGFVGEFSVRTLSGYLQSVRFKQTIQQMKNTIQPKGYWQVNERTLKILQINKQKFYETIPKGLQCKMNCDRVWLTIVFFVMICFHESKQRVKAMQKNMKETKKLQRKLSEYEIIEENENMTKRKQYEPSLDFMCILRFFEDNHIMFIEFHDDVTFLLNKVFARLK